MVTRAGVWSSREQRQPDALACTSSELGHGLGLPQSGADLLASSTHAEALYLASQTRDPYLIELVRVRMSASTTVGPPWPQQYLSEAGVVPQIFDFRKH